MQASTPGQRELTPFEAQLLVDLSAQCGRRFDESVFFRQLAAGAMSVEVLRYTFGQYGHFRIQLHRWFAACMLLVKDASRPAERWAVMSLSHHVFSDLRDDHDGLFAQCLQRFGLPVGTLFAGTPSPATERYGESFLEGTRAPEATWLEATAELAGRELAVALRNQRLIQSYFAPRGLTVPNWIALHAELEVDHCLAALRPVLAEHAGSTTLSETLLTPLERAFGRHAEYFDALFEEHARAGVASAG